MNIQNDRQTECVFIWDYNVYKMIPDKAQWKIFCVNNFETIA